jgi:hypothetical protein
MPPSQSSDPVDRPRVRAPAHLTSFNPKSKEIPVEGNSGAPVSFDVSEGDRSAGSPSAPEHHHGLTVPGPGPGGSHQRRPTVR